MKLPDKIVSDAPTMGQLLRSVGILPTTQRLRVADLVLSRHQHLSATGVYKRVNAAGTPVSRATIYNTLGLFVARGLVREIITGNNRIFYDSNISHHHHFFDTEAGELKDIEVAELKIIGVPKPPAGKVISEVDLVIRLKSQK